MSLNDVIFTRLRPYTIKMFAGQTKTNGRPVNSYTDTTVKLHIQPLSMAELKAFPEGSVSSQDLKGYAMPNVVLTDKSILTYSGNLYEVRGHQDWMDWGKFRCYILRKIDVNNY